MVNETDEARVLRAKYYDWCSARVADRFLRLSPDEIFELAQEASRRAVGATVNGAPVAGTDVVEGVASEGGGVEAWRGLWPAAREADEAEGMSYRTLVARVAEVLARQLALPTFEEWEAAYREEPGRFDPDLLGLWRDALQGDAD